MVAEDLINNMVPPLKATDDAHKAVVWMEEFRCKELPVVENHKLLGFISEEIILEKNDIESEVKAFDLVGQTCTVPAHAHLFDILRIASNHDLQMVAVVSEDQHYVGVVTIQDILHTFAQTAGVQMPGAVLVLGMNFTDYSLSEISRLIEENNGKILSVTVKQDQEESNKIRLTLKINQEDISRTVATLERFGYKVIGQYQDSKQSFDDRDKIEMLFRYLDI